MIKKFAISVVAFVIAALPLAGAVSAAALSTNPIANPSMETAGTAGPANWTSNAWGTTAAFEYVDGAAQNGSKSVKATVTALDATAPGDAKWFAAPVAIPAGVMYTYTDYYKSDVTTRVVAAYMDAAGTILSYGDLPDAPATANWAKYSGDFTMVTGAASVSIYHLIDKVGYLQLDNVTIGDAVVLPPSSGELDIPNPSVETTSNGTAPLGWQASGWGTNTRNFEYVNEGHNDAKSVKVTVADYVDGDAKWFFNPITTLKADGQYRASMWYKASADVQPKAVVMYTNAAGVQSFFGMPTPTPQAGQDKTTTWQPYNATFSVPQGAVSVSFFMYINQNGWLQTDDFALQNYAPQGFTQPMYTLTFDDGHEDNHKEALTKMSAHGFKSTQCYATTFIEDVANQPEVLAGIKKFTDAGHEICSHTDTHPDLTTLAADKLKFELEHPKEYLTSMLTQVGVPASQQTVVPNFASPYGAYNAQVNEAIKAAGYQSHRTVNEGYNSIDNFNAYELKVQNMLDTTTFEQFKSWVDQAKKDNTWLIFVYHRVADNPGPYDTKIADFYAQMDYLKQQNITPMTFQDAFLSAKAQAGGTTNPGDITPPSISNVTVAPTATTARIEWKANELAVHSFKYGTSATAGYDKTGNVQIVGGDEADLTNSRYVELTGLAPNTTYFYQVTATDNAGNIGDHASSFTTGTVTTPVDTTPPVILNGLVTTVAKNSASVSIVANELSTATVEYGTTNAYGTTAPVTTIPGGTMGLMETMHNAQLSGLQSNTTYYVKATVTDAANNKAVKEMSFTTLADQGQQDVTPPTFTTVNASNSGNTSMFIGWNTDEKTTSTLAYGVSQNYGSQATVMGIDTMFAASIDGLTPQTKYYYRITATDAAGNVAIHEGEFTPQQSAAKPGDVNGDFTVDALDLSTVLSNWNKTGMSRAQGDLNADGTVDALDLSTVLSNWSK